MDRLPKCDANFAPLSPITFLQRAAAVYADRASVIYGNTSFTWKQTYDRCRRLASSLRSLGNSYKNDVVSVLAPNIPALYEMHFAVPMAGAVLNAINTRLDAKTIATILAHAEAKIFFVDYQFKSVAVDALKHLINANIPLPLVVMIDDVDCPTGTRLGKLEYEELVAGGNPAHEPYRLEDEFEPIALNYTSGTTSAPKGVVYSHRGTYLSTLSLVLQWGVGNEPVYLWSLPMFHCNGWTFTWGMAARGGTNICIRTTSSAEMYRAIAEHKVTHMCCAPIVFKILLDTKPARPLSTTVEILTGGAPPPASLLEKMENLGFHVTHAYGMTEATGPALVCEWQSEWNRKTSSEKAKLKARQGISVLTLADVNIVRESENTVISVPRDGKTMGEIVLRGSSVMKGYLKNEEETAKSFRKGWFFTGDVGVVHPDGYIEIKDRSKDVIISGGENISSVEVESVLDRHPMVAEVAVVAMPHPHWGETPCAFVVLEKLDGAHAAAVDEQELIAYCKANMPGFMVPKKFIVVDEIPRNSNGKAMKNVLRERTKGLKITEATTKKQGRRQGNNGNVSREVNVSSVKDEQQVVALSRL